MGEASESVLSLINRQDTKTKLLLPELRICLLPQAIYNYMDPVSAFGIAASASQLAEQAAGIAKTLYDYFRSVRDAPKHSKELRIEALIVADVLEDLTSVLKDLPLDIKTGNTIDESVKEFAVTIREMARFIEVREDEYMKRFKWPFTQKENEKLIAKLERYKKTFHMALSVIERYNSIVRRSNPPVKDLKSSVIIFSTSKMLLKIYKG